MKSSNLQKACQYLEKAKKEATSNAQQEMIAAAYILASNAMFIDHPLPGSQVFSFKDSIQFVVEKLRKVKESLAS